MFPETIKTKIEEINLNNFSDCLVVKVKGIIDASNANTIFTTISEKIKDTVKFVLVDLIDTKYISSTGIGTLENIRKKVIPRNGELILVNANNLVTEIFSMYGFENLNSHKRSLEIIHEYTLERKPTIEYPIFFRCPYCFTLLKADKPKNAICSKCKSKLIIQENGSIIEVSKRELQKKSNDQRYRIEVYGENELIDSIRRGEKHFSHCISIGNPDQPVPEIIREHFTDLLRLSFYDVPSVEILSPGQIQKIPEIQDAKAVINFYNKTKNIATGYTIHCWQGVSRSTATAMAILYLDGVKEEILKEVLLSIRPEASPHSLLTSFFDQILNTRLSKIGSEIREEKIKKWEIELRNLVEK